MRGCAELATVPRIKVLPLTGTQAKCQVFKKLTVNASPPVLFIYKVLSSAQMDETEDYAQLKKRQSRRCAPCQLRAPVICAPSLP